MRREVSIFPLNLFAHVMDGDRLDKALHGKTHSQGGLNLAHSKQFTLVDMFFDRLLKQDHPMLRLRGHAPTASTEGVKCF